MKNVHLIYLSVAGALCVGMVAVVLMYQGSTIDLRAETEGAALLAELVVGLPKEYVETRLDTLCMRITPSDLTDDLDFPQIPNSESRDTAYYYYGTFLMVRVSYTTGCVSEISTRRWEFASDHGSEK